MSPRSASVNEELRRRSRERLLQAAVELVGEHGYEATTLGRHRRPGRVGARPGVVLLPRQAPARTVRRAPADAPDPARRRCEASRAPDGRAGSGWPGPSTRFCGLDRDRPVLMREHMAGILQAEGFIQCPEQQRLAQLLRGRPWPATAPARHRADYPLLRALLMGAVVAAAAAGRADADRPAARRVVPALRAGVDAGHATAGRVAAASMTRGRARVNGSDGVSH